MFSIKRSFTTLVATAALALSLTACGGTDGDNGNSAEPTKPSSTTKSDGGTNYRAIAASAAALLEEAGWVIDPDHAKSCVLDENGEWDAVCAIRVIPAAYPKGCLQTWFIQLDGNTATKFAMATGSKQFGPTNPKAGQVDPPKDYCSP